MSLMFGNYQDENVKPVLVDSQGRPLVVLDAVTGTYLNVDVHSLPPIPAGSNLIGKVDINSQPAGVLAGMTSLPAGSNNIGDVDVLSMPVTEIKGSNNNKIFAYESTIHTRIENTNLSSGTNTLSSDAIPDNKIGMITYAAIRYVGTVTNVRLYLSIIKGTVSTDIGFIYPPVSSYVYLYNGNFIVPAGGVLRLTILNATVGDDVNLDYGGYVMSVT